MWQFFGIGAICFAALNLAFHVQGKEPKWFRFASLSFTALTVCAFYSEAVARVLREDWAGLADVMPTLSRCLWVCVGLSVLVNGVSLFDARKR